MRDLLPDEYFRTAFYASINKHCSYHDFTRDIDGATVVPGDRSRPKGYHLRVLKRSVSTRGDQIIKWLETGVFEAIKRGYLDQLQICIFADEYQPTKVIELYCFHFHYSEPLQDGSIAVDLEVQDVHTKKIISLKNTREALNTVIKNMVGLNGTMPHLPERCFMSPYLVWNERRPSGYQPPGFLSSNDVNISFPVNEGWMMETSTCGQVKTGHRTVDLGIAYTKGVEFTLDDDGEAIVMPDFTYGGEFSRLESFINQAGNPQHQGKTPGSVVQELPTPRPSSVTGDDMDLSRPTAQKRHLSAWLPDNEIHISRHGTIDDGADTQDREDLSRLKALRPIEQHQMHDTQLVLRTTATPSQLDLSAVTTRNLQGERHDSERPRVTRSQGSKMSESMTISCECGTKETENVVQCRGCNGWQHAQCYAYNGPDDISMPAERMCYTCLLSNASGDHLDKAKELTRIRQVIHCIQARGLTSLTQISKTLGE
ncbi:uncharacterized protein N0V89_000328 [Didymosphaeria variabile]|uniref:HORMA domain-containing protein n=1 Tax=Didymosphaeria variabile TaxID=1932322 RepID=A0A9W8XWK1_9PLEO|nr:uncharacterized protein N0V89_000328 [Didymosphaeria variabile]KAJ4359772.1 hypothetical protein N0V89_000328 [Didymosphaeria variabile]